MNDNSAINARPVSASERFPFNCTGCAACCRHVPTSVALECLDIFRLTKYFRDRDTSIKTTDDFLARYAEPVLLDDCGFIIYMLKVQGDDDACIFLKENRCSIQEVKPRVCRIYPFIASPTANGRFEYMVSLEHPHHFQGATVSVKRWMNRFFFAEEKEALHMDYQSVPKIAGLMRRIPAHNRHRAVALFLWYRYSDYDLKHSFLEQFSANMEKLKLELQALAAEK
jgi:Fe-S-cluster containining protein